MRSILFITLSLFITVSSFAQDNSTAPTLKYEVIVNGEKYSVADGEMIKVGDTEITVKSSDNLHFKYGALEFEYPKHFGFEYDEDFAFKNWTLDGNDFVIMYFEFGLEVSLDDFAKEMSKQFGRGNVKTTNIKKELGGQKMEGRRLEVSLLGERLDYEILLVNGSDFKTHLLTFQDSVDDDGSPSQEATETVELINQTLIVE